MDSEQLEDDIELEGGPAAAEEAFEDDDILSTEEEEDEQGEEAADEEVDEEEEEEEDEEDDEDRPASRCSNTQTSGVTRQLPQWQTLCKDGPVAECCCAIV